jgi:hypothetical protein
MHDFGEARVDRWSMLFREFVLDIAHLVQPAALVLGPWEDGREGLPSALRTVGNEHGDVLEAAIAKAFEDYRPAFGALAEGILLGAAATCAAVACGLWGALELAGMSGGPIFAVIALISLIYYVAQIAFDARKRTG